VDPRTGLDVVAKETNLFTVTAENRTPLVQPTATSATLKGTVLTSANYRHRKIKSRLNSGKARYYSLRNMLFPRLLTKNANMKTQTLWSRILLENLTVSYLVRKLPTIF
jgi:hypothetical protein